MEPSELELLRNKLREEQELHKHEMEVAKPFVWSAVQQNIGKRKSMTWMHLAAAVVLLLICFSFILYGYQHSYQKEIHGLTSRMDELQQAYDAQMAMLQSKNQQVENLGIELRMMETQLASLEQWEPQQKEIYIYQTDTVYLKQVEYITKEIETPTPALVPLEETETTQIADLPETSEVIYPRSSQGKSESSESIKLTFGAFTARN